jgi:thiamine kinase
MTPPNVVLASLVAKGIVVSSDVWHTLRGGRTNRVWRIETATGPLVCKLYCRVSHNPLYPNLPLAEHNILQHLTGQNIAPKVVDQISTDEGEVLVYKFVKGQIWRSGVQDVAVLLAKVHALTCNSPMREVPSGSLALVRQTQRILAQCQSAAEALTTSIERDVSPVSIPVLIHTDVVPSNLITTSQGLRLIDWQCPGLGDPCEDIASFLSPAMQHLYGAAPLSADQAEVFLAAYARPKIIHRYRLLAPLFHWRAAAYCLWKAEQGCKDYISAFDLEMSALQETRCQHGKAGQNNTDANIA